MKKIKQVRYYSANSDKNYPDNTTHQRLVSGSAFTNYLPIVQLGVQCLPGTKFYLNNSSDPIIIGSTGIYEIDLIGETEISALSFDSGSISAVNNNDNASLIVDMIYEDGED